jgi:hypothetical protein
MPYFAAAACLLVAFAPARAYAQSDYDTALLEYELTTAKVKAWEQASVAAAQALKGRTDQAEEELDDADQSLEEMVARMDAVPEIRRSVHQAGLSTRDYVMIGFVIFQAMMADQILEMNPQADPPKNLNPANLDFVRTHKAEVQQSFQAVQAASADEGE